MHPIVFSALWLTYLL
jgi:MFS family permease